MQFTLRRLMLEVAFAAVMLAGTGAVFRVQTRASNEMIPWVGTMGWVGMLLMVRWVYRDFRNPFGG